jgi:hypothetical protein
MVVLPKKLLAVDEPAPVSVYNEGGKSPFLLVADHAGNLIPRALGRLGIAEGDCERHRLGHRHRQPWLAFGKCARCDTHPAKLFAPRH